MLKLKLDTGTIFQVSPKFSTTHLKFNLKGSKFDLEGDHNTQSTRICVWVGVGYPKTFYERITF
jgi:hypothetical protein